MKNIGLEEYIVCWTPVKWGSSPDSEPVPGAVVVDRLGSETYWDRRYRMTSGMCYQMRHKMSRDQKIMMMFIDFHTCVVRDGIDPQVAHREFLKIDEYRRRISPDISGADV